MSAASKTGKGKKKAKETKVTLEEFNQVQVPIGHTIVNIPVQSSGLDWAATMAEHDSIAQEKQVFLPQAPKSHLSPSIDPDQLPQEPPFKVTLNNIPFGITEQDIIDRFFKNIKVKLDGITIDRASATVELETVQDLYEALCKSGTTLKNKEVSVTLFGQNSYGNSGGYHGGRQGGYNDRGYGNRTGERSGGFRDKNATGGFGGGGGGTDEPDRTDSDWRSAQRPAPPTTHNMYSNDNRMGGNQRSQYGSRRSYDPENRNKYEGRSSYPERPGGVPSNNNRDSFSDRGGDERFSRHRMMQQQDRQPERDFANVRREQNRPNISNYPVSRMERDNHNNNGGPSDSQYAPTESVQSIASNETKTINDPRSITPQSSSQNRPLLDGPNSEPLLRRTEPPRRPVLNLQRRTKPIESDSASTRNPAIFGEAQPVDTRRKYDEIDARLNAINLDQNQPEQSDKPASAPRSRRVSEAVSETSSNTVAKE